MAIWKPHDYQKVGVNFITNRLFLNDHQGAGLFANPGLGKTSMTLAALKVLRFYGVVRNTLIVAPLRVCYSVWGQEAAKWDNFAEFNTRIVHGTKRKKEDALADTEANIHLINPEGLVATLSAASGTAKVSSNAARSLRPNLPSWDTLVLDESTLFKNWTAKRTKFLRKILSRFKKRLILTGTPAPNSLADLFSQIFVLDDGQALGKNVTAFRARYMEKGGFKGRVWKFLDDKADELQAKVSPLVLRMDSESNLNLPARVDNLVWVDLGEKHYKEYRVLERDLFVALDSGEDIVASHAGAKYGLCRGFANGGIYENETKLVMTKHGPRERRVRVDTHHIHDKKTEAVVELVGELHGKPLLVAYQFDHDLERLQKKFPKAPVIKGGVKGSDSARIIDDWNAGKVPVLLVQPQSLSHGANMQGVGAADVCWYGLTDNPEIYQQFNKRLHRQGVKETVRIHHVLARGTIDEVMLDRLRLKGNAQETLMEAIAAYRKRRGLD